MTEKTEPTVTIVINCDGVKVVQFCGDGWQDEGQAQLIYEQIKPLIRQIDIVLKGDTETIVQ